MGISVGGGKRGTFTEMNVVPLIDILLVLLVIFVVIPNSQGLKGGIPQSTEEPRPNAQPNVIVVHGACGRIREGQSTAGGVAVFAQPTGTTVQDARGSHGIIAETRPSSLSWLPGWLTLCTRPTFLPSV
jgi:hypothetical protein